jgi:2-polyprenyl-6-methoxyphenol hydroxylase-like FAD-dependent oxidoreductase
MLTRKELAQRWRTTPRTVDRRRMLGLLPWIDLTQGRGSRPQIRFRLEDIVEYERQARMCFGGDAGHSCADSAAQGI